MFGVSDMLTAFVIGSCCGMVSYGLLARFSGEGRRK